jgi:hypothetical protein
VTSDGHVAAATDGHGPLPAGRRLQDRARGLPWPRVLALVALVGAIIFVANSCQRSQVRIDQDRAVATARAQVDFRPRAEQVRLVRQGLTSHPYWAVSLSVPSRSGFEELAVVKVDANTGEVVSVATQQPSETPPP